MATARPRLLAATAAFLCAVAATWTYGQSMGDPITWKELCIGVRERGAPLDAEAWAKVRPMYDRYLDACAELRFGPAAGRLPATDGDGPDAESLRARQRQSERQARTDQQLIDELMTVANAACRDRERFLRTWCERRFLLSTSFADNAAARYVPGRMRRARWTRDDDRALVQSAMDDLEVRLVALERRSNAVIVACARAWADGESHFPPRPQGDEQAMDEWREAGEMARRAAYRPYHELEAQIAREVDEACASLAARLSPEGRRVAFTVWQDRFDELDPPDPRGELLQVRCWMSREGVSLEARDEVRRRVERWRDDDDRLQAEWMREARAWAEARILDRTDPLPDGSERQQACVEAVGRVTARRREAAAALVAASRSALGLDPETAVSLGDAVVRRIDRVSDPLFAGLRCDFDAEEGWGDEWSRDAANDGDETEDDADEFGSESATVDLVRSVASDAWIGPPPSRASLTAFLDQCNADASTRMIVGSLYDDLFQQWSSTVEPLRMAITAVATADDEGRAQTAAPERIAAASRQARTAASDIESAFFASLRAVVPEVWHDALAVWEVDETIGDPEWSLGHRGGLGSRLVRHPNAVRHANAARAIRMAALDPSDRAVAEQILAARQSSLVDAARQIDDAECRMLELRYAVDTRVRWARQRRLPREEIRAVYAEASNEVERAGQQLAAVVSTARVADLDLRRELAAALSPDGAEGLESTFRRIMYPWIDHDRRHHERVAQRAIAVLRRDQDRVARVTEVIEWWSGRYDAITDEMSRLGVEPLAATDESALAPEEHEARTQWLRFRREQVNFMLLHAIGLVVTEEERARLPRLPMR